MMYDHSDKVKATLYDSLVLNFKEVDISLYTVDMSNSFNKDYESTESNKRPQDANELAINGPTIIRFRDGMVREYIEGTDKAVDYLRKQFIIISSASSAVLPIVWSFKS